MGEKKYKVWQSLIAEISDKYGVPKGANCIDLCCGTGNISKILIDLGFVPFGLYVKTGDTELSK